MEHVILRVYNIELKMYAIDSMGDDEILEYLFNEADNHAEFLALITENRPWLYDEAAKYLGR